MSWERVTDSGIDTHAASWFPEDYIGYGAGWTLLDADGDGQLDLLGGRTPEEDSGGACLYRNISEPGDIRFEADARVCGQNFRATSVSAFDVDGDGRDEMFLMFFQHILQLSLSDSGVEQRALFDARSFADERGLCDPSTIVPIDIDMDGDLDGLVGCTAPNNRVRNAYPEETPFWLQTHLLRNTNGELRLETGEWSEEPGMLGNPLTFGLVDLNQDGLIDLVAANDSFSTVGRRNTHLAPGTLHVRCTPEQTCTWTDRLMVDGDRAYGSFMGVAVLHRAMQRLLVLTDWGPKRALDLGSDGWPDVASRTGLRLAENDGFALFSWSTFVDDFDLDGLDDIFFSHGMIADGDVPGHSAHVPFLLIQGQDGEFSLYRDGLGFSSPAERIRVQPEVPPSQRSAIRADFDRDGKLDLLMVYALGYPELYTDASGRSTRCTIFPNPSFAPAWGHSFAFRLHPDDVWHEWFVWGGMRVGNANALLLPARQGELRWPSGAVTPWDCGIRTTLSLDEPDWLSLTRTADGLTVLIDTEWWGMSDLSSLRLHWKLDEQRGEGTVRRESDSIWRVTNVPEQAFVMLQIDEYFVSRWWQP